MLHIQAQFNISVKSVQQFLRDPVKKTHIEIRVKNL